MHETASGGAENIPEASPRLELEIWRVGSEKTHPDNNIATGGGLDVTRDGLSGHPLDTTSTEVGHACEAMRGLVELGLDASADQAQVPGL